MTTQTGSGSFSKYRFGAYAVTIRSFIAFLTAFPIMVASLALADGGPLGVLAIVPVEVALLAVAISYYLGHYVALHAKNCTVVIAGRGEVREHTLLDGYRLTIPRRESPFEPQQLRLGAADSKGTEVGPLVAQGRFLEPIALQRMIRHAERIGLEVVRE